VADLEIKISVPGKYNDETISLRDDATVLDVLEDLGLFPDEVIIISEKRLNKPIPVDSEVIPGDRLRLIPVASGG